MRIRPWMVIVGGGLLGTPIAAQGPVPADTVRPGDFDAADVRLTEHRVTWDVFTEHPDGRRVPLAVWTDTERRVEVEGRSLLHFETRATYADGRERRDVVERDPGTWAIRSVELYGYNATKGWAFMGYRPDHVDMVFRRSPGEETRWETSVLGGPVFWAGDGAALVRAVPRDVGSSFAYPAHDGRYEGVSWITVRVTGREPDPVHPERWPDLLVLQNSLGWKSWMSREPPYVVRLEVHKPDGSKDVWVFREMQLLDRPEHGVHP